MQEGINNSRCDREQRDGVIGCGVEVFLCILRGMVLRHIHIPMGITQRRGEETYRKRKKWMIVKAKSLRRSEQIRTQLEGLALVSSFPHRFTTPQVDTDFRCSREASFHGIFGQPTNL